MKNFLLRLLAPYLYPKKPRELIDVQIHIADHCNLKCWGCDHFSPLANEGYADVDGFTRDMRRLGEIFNGQASRIALLGGEPLLNPEVERFFPIARSFFPAAPIHLVTNGVLLGSKPDGFWAACRHHNISIVVTIYPGLEKSFTANKDKADSMGVMLLHYGKKPSVLKTSRHEPLDLEGRQRPEDSFKRCPRANHCIQLLDGRLYTCTTVPNVRFFNNYFDKNLPISDKDSIDIHRAKNASEIFNFLARPIPFCRFCNIKKSSRYHPWRISDKNIKEWTA